MLGLSVLFWAHSFSRTFLGFWTFLQSFVAVGQLIPLVTMVSVLLDSQSLYSLTPVDFVLDLGRYPHFILTLMNERYPHLLALSNRSTKLRYLTVLVANSRYFASTWPRSASEYALHLAARCNKFWKSAIWVKRNELRAAVVQYTDRGPLTSLRLPRLKRSYLSSKLL